MSGAAHDSPTDLPPVDPADFRKAVQLGEVVLEGTDDDPLKALAAAYGEYFGTGSDEVLSMILRFFALGTLLESARLEPWMEPVPDDPDAVDLADAALYVAADEPLNDAGEFDAGAFVERLRGIDPRDG